MTIYDIAREAGVSASTVSRVINNKPGINAETRRKVQQLLEHYNYSPNEAARGLVMQSSKIIGILIEDIRIEHHTESAYIVEQELTKLGYTCITMSTGASNERKAEYIRILEQRRVEGAILMGSMFGTEEVKKSIQEHLSNVPVAIVNGYLDLPNVYSTLVDEERGVENCVELLFARGKKHPVFVQDMPTPSGQNKQRGFMTAMLRRGLKESDGILFQAYRSNAAEAAESSPRFVMQRGEDATLQVLKDKPETDAIIYATDLLAIGGLRALDALGKCVPEDVSVIGIDNTLYGQICSPRLTTLDNKLVEVSENASRALLDALEKKVVPHRVMLFTEIEERETT